MARGQPCGCKGKDKKCKKSKCVKKNRCADYCANRYGAFSAYGSQNMDRYLHCLKNRCGK